MWYYVVAIVILISDQVTKWLIVKTMELGESIPIIENIFYITSHRNRGAAFGILQGQMWFFYVVTVFVVGFVIYYLHKEAKNKPLMGLSLGLVLGGAIGNFIDRVFRGEVVDFLDVIIITYDFPIFNVADSALVVGLIVIMVYVLFEDRKTRENS
ncbi:signal peptidase II [Anaerobacillus sp. MEB173]|uniref:signal peptidase II n=1 Tax=Anaerobacillus sp. MEB173 TaxID=3383345 RepID=UPI003F921748